MFLGRTVHKRKQWRSQKIFFRGARQLKIYLTGENAFKLEFNQSKTVA